MGLINDRFFGLFVGIGGALVGVVGWFVGKLKF
jgi:hypothetical protein